MYPTTKLQEIIDRGPIYKASYYIMTLKKKEPLPVDLNGDLYKDNAREYYSSRRDNGNYR